MKKNKLLIGLLAGLFLCGTGVVENNLSNIVFAKADSVFNVEQYTKSDKLLLSDGTDSLNRDIKNFADDVKSATSNADCSEITQVIPKQYMEATTTNAVYQYNGEEYGFYMVKEGEYFDLLLIDFTYVFIDGGDHNNDYKLRVEPILQQSFLRESTSNGYVWKKYGGTNRYTYYVANPRFANVLQNENQLNCGDLGYSKQADTGVIIQQARLNYGKISYKTEGDLLELVAEFTLEKMIDNYIMDPLDELTGGISGYIEDYTELRNDIYEQGKEQTVPANNEVNILTQQSRTDQLNNANSNGFSRVVLAQPKEEVILSEADDSYAECIVLLNDTNAKARLTQICDFDIVKRMDNWSSMEYVPQVETGKDFSVSKQRILFDEETIWEQDTMEYYTLANGVHKFSFTPEYSGNYTINSGKSNVLITLDGVAKNASNITQWMEAGTEYIIGFTATQTIRGTATMAIAPIATSVTIPAGKAYIGKYTPTANGVYTITAGTADIEIFERCFPCSYLRCEGTGSISTVLEQGEDYYVVIRNTASTTANISIAVNISNPPSIAEGGSVVICPPLNEATFIRFEALTQGKYNFAFAGRDAYMLTFEMFTETGVSVAINTPDDFMQDALEFYTEQTIPAGVYFIRVENGAGDDIECSCSMYTSSVKWMVNGQEYNGQGLKRGQQYTIALYNNENEPMNLLLRNDANQTGISFSLGSSGYILNVGQTAQMYDDYADNQFKYRIVTNDPSIYLDVPVVYNQDLIELIGTSVSMSVSSSYVSFSLVLGTGQTAQVHFSYKLDNANTTYSYTKTVSQGSVQQNIEQLTSFSGHHRVRDLTIDHIYFYNSAGSQLGRINNSLKYPNAVNKVLIDSINLGAKFEDGTGTANDPFILTNYKHLTNVASVLSVSNSACFKLDNNIAIPSGQSFAMLNYTYNGTFDGNEFEINGSSFTKLSTGNMALFETIGANGVIKDLYLTFTYNISAGSGKSVGSVAVTNNGIIQNCTIRLNYEQANPGEYVGGVVAKNQAIINGCVVRGFIDGAKYLGGIAGYNQSTIKNCVTNIQLNYTYRNTNTDYIGGIAGYSLGGSIINNEYNGLIYIDVEDWESREYAPYVGGIIGYVSGSATISGNSFTGWLDIDNLNPDVTWKTGFIFTTTHHFNQQQNVSDTYNP